MGKLIYISNVSLDGFIEDEHGQFDFTEPGEDAFVFITDLIRPVGTFLYGRRLYETMAVWETEPAFAAESGTTDSLPCRTSGLSLNSGDALICASVTARSSLRLGTSSITTRRSSRTA